MFEYLEQHDKMTKIRDTHPMFYIYKFSSEENDSKFMGFINVPRNEQNNVYCTVFIDEQEIEEKNSPDWFIELMEETRGVVYKRDRVRKIF